MIAEYVDLNGKRIQLSSDRPNYILPGIKRILLMDYEGDSIFVNGRTVSATDKSLPIEIQKKELVIECGKTVIKITPLIDQQSEKFKNDYHNFAGQLRHNCDLQKGFNQNELSTFFTWNNPNNFPALCTFCRAYEGIKEDSRIKMIAQDIGHLVNVFLKPRIHLLDIVEIQPIDTVARIGHEAIKHLASHSEHWESRKASGLVPARLLARTLTDDYGIYENVAAKCLIDNIHKFAKKMQKELRNLQIQLPTEEGMLSLNSEDDSYYRAVKFLMKGYSDDQILTVNDCLLTQLANLDKILFDVARCKDSLLYKELLHCSIIRGQLKPTNIFMMDKEYKYVYKLWNLPRSLDQAADEPESPEVENEYALYCQTMVLFALNYYNFKGAYPDQPAFAEDGLLKGTYHFDKWALEIQRVAEVLPGLDGIVMTMSWKREIKVNVKKMEVPEQEEIERSGYILHRGDDLVFERKPTEEELSQFCDLVRQKAKGDRDKGKRLYNNLKKAIADIFMNYDSGAQKILLLPLPFKFLDSSLLIHKCIDGLRLQLENYLAKNAINSCYFLSPFRPTDYHEFDCTESSEILLDYGYHIDHLNTEKAAIRYGLLPITMDDINSYRRITKVLLIHMLALEADPETCPNCGSKVIIHNKNGLHQCSACEFSVYHTRCNSCVEYYTFSKHNLPKTNARTGDSSNLNLLVNEVKEGFKYITKMVTEGGKTYPVCPKCGAVHRSN